MNENNTIFMLKQASKLDKIKELREEVKPYGSRPPFDVRKRIEKVCMMEGIDNWLVFCDEQKFNTTLTKENINAF